MLPDQLHDVRHSVLALALQLVVVSTQLGHKNRTAYGGLNRDDVLEVLVAALGPDAHYVLETLECEAGEFVEAFGMARDGIGLDLDPYLLLNCRDKARALAAGASALLHRMNNARLAPATVQRLAGPLGQVRKLVEGLYLEASHAATFAELFLEKRAFLRQEFLVGCARNAVQPQVG